MILACILLTQILAIVLFLLDRNDLFLCMILNICKLTITYPINDSDIENKKIKIKISFETIKIKTKKSCVKIKIWIFCLKKMKNIKLNECLLTAETIIMSSSL